MRGESKTSVMARKSEENKPKFEESLKQIRSALEWAEKQDVDRLRKFFLDSANVPLYCFSSGGASSALEYAALLYECNQGMSKPLTPLMMASISDEALKRAKILIVTGDGDGWDEKYTSKRASLVNPQGTCAIVRECGKDNYVVNTLKKVTTNWYVYKWLTQPNSFIATIETMCKFGLFYKAFTNDSNIVSKLDIDITPSHCFSYAPRVEGAIPKLQEVKNYIVLYSGWSKPVATDFECKMIEGGFASVQLCDYRNFCHGRFIFLSKHLADSALVLFLTPREQQFAKDLILESITWRDKTDVFPTNTPIIKIETEFDNPLATIDLMIKMQVCFNDIAKDFGDEPCDPKNPCVIDKRFPRSTPFKELLEMGALGGKNSQGSIGTLKQISRKKALNYDPTKSIAQIARKNGVAIATIRKYIQDMNIDRNRDEKMNTYNKVWLEYLNDSLVSQTELAKKLGMSVNTIRQYLNTKAEDIKSQEGKVGMAVEHPTVKELREVVPELEKRFDRFCSVRDKYVDLTAEEYLKKLNWSADKHGRNLRIVNDFMLMKDFKFKYKNRIIELIYN